MVSLICHRIGVEEGSASLNIITCIHVNLAVSFFILSKAIAIVVFFVFVLFYDKFLYRFFPVSRDANDLQRSESKPLEKVAPKSC